jgi:hypothetical protein
MGRIQFLVFDSATNQPVPAFSGVFTDGDRRQKLEVTEGGQGSLDIPLDAPGNLLVESEGYTPQSREGYSVGSTAREVQLTIYLDPVAPFSGIEIRAMDDRGMPVSHLRVTARQSDDDRAPPLWVRRASDERGIYQLPDLPPAIYRLSLVAIDAEGQPLTLVPHTETVIFRGHEQIPVTVQFRPGALLTIAVRDAAGAQLRGAEVSLRMIFPDGNPRSVAWRSTVDGEVLERRDGLPAAAQATLNEPLPPGSYELVLQLPSGLEQRLAVQLLAGQHQQLELTL